MSKPARHPAPGANSEQSSATRAELPLIDAPTTPRPPLPLSLTERHPAAIPLVEDQEPERADAARNRQLLMEAATRLIESCGASAVTMDAVAREAGVGKGTVFRRFGNRSGLMLALLNHSEKQLQQAFLTGPAPLGPGDPGQKVDPLDRLIAFGRARLTTAAAHLDVLLEAEDTGPQRFSHPTRTVVVTHTRMLLTQMGFRGNLELMCIAVLAPLEAPAIHHMLHNDHMSLGQIADRWEELVRALTPPRR
ncbi:TetR/AcrR family transcriptional regulator [Williamsia sp. R60]